MAKQDSQAINGKEITPSNVYYQDNTRKNARAMIRVMAKDGHQYDLLDSFMKQMARSKDLSDKQFHIVCSHFRSDMLH